MRPGSSRRAGAFGFIWGFAEATLFFIVPDVLMTSYALSSLKRAVIASLFAAFGAALGGGVILASAHQFPMETTDVLLAVPGVSQSTFLQVQTLLQNGLLTGLLLGAFSGVPFKAFAAEAGMASLNPAVFMMLTPVARLPRFLLLAVVAACLSRAIGNRLSAHVKLLVSLVLWLVFYMGYFAAVGW